MIRTRVAVPGLLAALVLASCAGAGTGSQAGESRTEVRAPIVRVALRVAESHPPQYFADVPADGMVMCTMLYGEHESAVPLGSDFRPGARYTLDVNGTRQSFVAQ